MTGMGASGNVLSIKPFRRLWVACTLSGLGDWLSILALTSLATILTAGDGFQRQSYAVGGVFIAIMLPALLVDPIGGALANAFDRRLVMAAADVLRFAVILTVPLVDSLTWLLVAAFLVACATRLWTPAREALAADLVPPESREQAARIGVFTAYGAAPVAGVIFAVLAVIADHGGFAHRHRADLALYVTAVVFLLAALTVLSLRPVARQVPAAAPSALRQFGQGRRLVGQARLLRGLAVGLVGALVAAAGIIGAADVYVRELGGGQAGYGTVFAAAFVGLALGMFLGRRMLTELSRRRLFGLAICWAGLMAVLVAVIQNLVVVVFGTAFLGAGAGVAWAVGIGLIASPESDDDTRALVQGYLRSLARIVLLVALAAVPLAAGAIGPHHSGSYLFDGTNALIVVSGLIAVLTGVLAYRLMDDRRGVPLRRDLGAALRRETYVPPGTRAVRRGGRGLLLAFDGGDGAGKTTQSRLTAIWLRELGYDVVTTREPGSTKIGMRLRALLLDRNNTGMSSRAETLLYAADRADHVDAVIEPALRRGAIVVTDRYIDSTLAYQGYGRGLDLDGVRDVNTWATDGLVPDLTVVLDVPADLGQTRLDAAADRMESEPREFHDRVRRGFRALAAADPDRHLVIDGSRPQPEITRDIQDRVRAILPDPVPAGTEDVTSTFPAIKDA